MLQCRGEANEEDKKENGGGGVGGVDRFRTAGEGVGELGKKGRRMGSVKRS